MDAPLLPGTHVARRYEIIRALGHGGMAWVYRARHLELGSEVALKVLPPLPTREQVTRFEREAKNAARLVHPGCVRVHDAGRAADDTRFLAMELLTGPTLCDRLEDGPLPAREVAQIGCDLLEALAHAHHAGILHRDIKPSNVMFRHGPDGSRRAVLIDFGLSRVLEDAPLTATGSCVGSPSYLAPERVLGREYDGRADLYGAGILLYELVTGTRPFVASSPTEVARQHIERPVPPVADRRADAPPGLARAIERALAKSPADRYACADAMKHALARGAEGPAAPTAELTAPVEVVTLAAEPWWRRVYARVRFGGWRRPRLAATAPAEASS